jgi:hypothetical protein
MGRTDLFYVKALEQGLTGKDADIFGFYASFDKLNMFKTVDVLGAWWDQRATASKNRYGTFGLRAAADFNAIDVDGEVLGQFGKKTVASGYEDAKGLSFDLDVGYNMNNHRFGAMFVYANTEFDAAFASADREASSRGHRYMGDSQLLTRNNVMSLALVNDLSLSKEFMAAVDGYYHMAAKDDFATAGGRTIAGKRALGMELNLVLAYMPVDMLTFELGYAMFKPLDGLKDAGQRKMYQNTYLEGAIRF